MSTCQELCTLISVCQLSTAISEKELRVVKGGGISLNLILLESYGV